MYVCNRRFLRKKTAEVSAEKAEKESRPTSENEVHLSELRQSVRQQLQKQRNNEVGGNVDKKKVRFAK